MASQTQSPIPAEAAQTSSHQRSGAQLFHQTLIEQGVEIAFGYPGGAILPTFDAFYQSPIKFVLSRHEQGAGHMADGYARATGKVGVVIATSGPGATNLVTALATANMDSVPVVAFTGQVATAAIGNDAFQEADVTGVTRPVTKHNVLVKRVQDLPRIVKEAFHIASTGRPGAVLVDIPKDVQAQMMPVPDQVEIDLPGYKPRTRGNMRQIRLAAEAINASQRPVLYVGGGVIRGEATEELMKMLCEDELRDAVLLIYANKQDLPNAMSVSEMIEAMKLGSLTSRQWHVEPTCGTTGEGLYEGLAWMHDTLKARRQ